MACRRYRMGWQGGELTRAGTLHLQCIGHNFKLIAHVAKHVQQPLILQQQSPFLLSVSASPQRLLDEHSSSFVVKAV